MKCRLAPVLKQCQSPLPGHCCNSGIFHGASPRCFPYTTVSQLTQPVVGYRDTALELGLLIPLLLDAGTSSCTSCPPASRWDFPTPHSQPHKFYSTSVTNELVRTLGLSDKTPPGLPGLKPSSNSVLPVAWITRPATDLRLRFQIFKECKNFNIVQKFRIFHNYLVNEELIKITT